MRSNISPDSAKNNEILRLSSLSTFFAKESNDTKKNERKKVRKKRVRRLTRSIEKSYEGDSNRQEDQRTMDQPTSYSVVIRRKKVFAVKS